MIHTVIFDVGGTLVKARSTLITFAEQLKPDDYNELLSFMIKEFMKIYRDENPPKFITIKEIIAIVLKKASAEFGVKDISGETDRRYGENYLNHANLFDDTIPTLEKLKKLGIKLIVASDADPDVLNEELSTFKIFKYFDRILISGAVKAYKPSDKMVDAIKDQCEEPYSGILFVGDTEVDILSAKKMGARSVLIRRNGEFPLKADYCITSLESLFDIINDGKKYIQVQV